MITQGSPLVKCRYCPAHAVWATYEQTSRRTLVDPLPTVNGNIELTRKTGTALIARVVPVKERGQHTELYLSHFVSCPGRDKARSASSRQTMRRTGR